MDKMSCDADKYKWNHYKENCDEDENKKEIHRIMKVNKGSL